MKFAIISDIHGNLFALNAVLKDIKLKNVDRILCLGDLAMAGPEPNKTIDFVKTQDWTVIQGNTDFMIANFSSEIFEKVAKNAPVMANALSDDISDISSENIEYLKNLPVNKSINLDGLRFLLVHASPRRNDENIYPNLKMDEIEEIVKDVDADVIFCGHTHIPCGYQTESKVTVVNVGSVGRPFTDDAKPCYAIANVSNGQVEIEHCKVDYDNVLASNLLEKRNFEGADKLAKMLIKPEFRHM